MNTSNPYGTERIAREHQAEIEKQLRQAAQLRGARPMRAPSLRGRRRAIGTASLSIVGVIIAIIASQLH